jgi:hypothetical protein
MRSMAPSADVMYPENAMNRRAPDTNSPHGSFKMRGDWSNGLFLYS